MENAKVSRILAIDVGSSSIKYAFYILERSQETEITSGNLELVDGDLQGVLTDVVSAVDAGGGALDAIGYRIVFSAGKYWDPAHATRQVLRDLESLTWLEPLHHRLQLGIVEQLKQRFKNAEHILCFDSAFFRNMPELAQHFPLSDISDPLLRRFGYHGLSYEYIVAALGDMLRGNAIVAHLGNGASLCALRDGKPLDTTMGFTPLGGIMMGTRPGDLDPGVALYFMKRGYTRKRLTKLLYGKSGLLGVSGVSSDMRILLERAEHDERAAFAIELFLYQLRKQLGALIAVLGGLDTFVFAGGIGENVPAIRERIVDSLSFLRTKPGVHVVRTNENLMIARHVEEFLQSERS